MINLLPEKNKKKLKKEKSFRLFLILSVYFTIFLLFFSATLFALEEISKNSLLEEEINLRSTEDSFEIIKRVEAKTKEVNEILRPLSNFYTQQVSVSDLTAEVFSLMPPYSSVENFSFKLKNGSGEVNLTGYAANYQVLLDIEEKLKDKFTDVDFDASSWLKINDINFSVTFKTK